MKKKKVGRANTLVLCFANSYCLIQEKTKAQLQYMAYIIWYLMMNAEIQTQSGLLNSGQLVVADTQS